MNLLTYIVIFSLIGGVASLIGGIIVISRNNASSGRLNHFIGFATGALLGAAFLELLPEAIAMNGQAEEALTWALTGFVIFFLLEGLMHWCNRPHPHEKDEPIGGHHDLSHTPWMLIISDTIHNAIDGVAIATAFFVSVPLGIITTFAIAAHEIPQEIGDMMVMLHAGWNKGKIIFWNVVSAFSAVIGALATFFLRDTIEPIAGTLLALTAGLFIYIGASDLVPELYRNTRRDKLSHVIPLFLVGIALVALLTKLAGILE